MKKIFLMVLSMVLGLTSFVALSQTNYAANNNLAKDIVGEWRNVYLKLVVNNKSKPTTTILVDSTNWETKLGIKPIHTTFSPNGTYHSEYYNLKDSIIKKSAGNWSIKGDSITMAQQTPSKTIYTYLVSISNGYATFHGIIDFDGEGVLNDDYYGIQKKFK